MKAKKLFSIILASGVLFAAGCAAPGEVHSPASSEGTTTSQPAVSSKPVASSQVPVSSAPASSKPSPASSKPAPVSSSPTLPDDYKPAVSLNLSFDPRVYVETVNYEGYFNQKEQFICWADVGKNNAVPSIKTHVIKGKHLNFYYYPENSPKYKKWMQTELNNLIRVSGDQGFEEYNRTYATTLYLCGVRENGTPYFPREISGDPEEQARIDDHLKTVNAWRDLVHFMCVNGDAVGLKKDGTVLHAPKREWSSNFRPTGLEQVFHPEQFHDIVAIDYNISSSVSYLYLLRKDGVLFDESGKVVYEQVERLIPRSIYGGYNFIVRTSGQVIRLYDGKIIGVLKAPEKVVTIRDIGSGTYALMEDGGFQMVYYDNGNCTDYYEKILFDAIKLVKDCKTT